MPTDFIVLRYALLYHNVFDLMIFHSYMNVEGQSALKIEPWTANASQIALYAYPFQIVYCNTNPIFGQANGNVFRIPMNLAGQMGCPFG